MKNNEEQSNASPRVACRIGRCVRSANSGEPGTMAGTMISRKTRKRIQAISIEGSVVERYFDVASEVPRKIVASRSKPDAA